MNRPDDQVDFLSGQSGHIAGIRANAKAAARDAVADAISLAELQRPRLDAAARAAPRRRVLVLAIEHLGLPNVLAAALRELHRTRHALTVRSGPTGARGKFENLNSLLDQRSALEHDWLLVLDDDVVLSRRFLDHFLFLIERFGLVLAQPAHRARSHAAWSVTRRQPGVLLRETGIVEIGPVTAFHRSTFQELLPFPPLRFGWGLDLRWAAIARERGWRIGVADATPIAHRLRPVSAAYARADAIEEARRFLANRSYVPAAEANRTVARHRSWT